MHIRLGRKEDIDALEQLYDDVNDYLAATTNYTGWRKGIYPAREDAVEGVKEGSLFVAVEKDEVVGSMILKHKQEAAYAVATWQAVLDNQEVLVIYTFVVNPKYLQCGIGKKMLAFASQHAANEQVKALRLDVYEKNIPAIKLYEKCGFKYIDTVRLGLEQYGLDWFKLYEKLV